MRRYAIPVSLNKMSGKTQMRFILLMLGVCFAGGCALSVRQQSRSVAHSLGIAEQEVTGMVQAAAEKRGMKVEWVRRTTDALVEVGFKYPGSYRSGGVVVGFRQSDGRWLEDAASRRTWRPETGLTDTDRDPIIYPTPPAERP